MSPRFGAVNRRKKAGELRRSQTITTYGCGALVDFPRLSGIMTGLDEWEIGIIPEELIVHERNLEEYLGKDFFVQAISPSANDYSENNFGLPVSRFPAYYYCPECHMLDYFWKIGSRANIPGSKINSALTCNHCGPKVKLIPSRFIVACINGHLDDFPYSWWVHRGKDKCENPRLKLEYKGKTGGLDSIHIYCETCKNSATMAGCMGKESLNGLNCKGKMPWLGKDYVEPETCKAQLRTLQRGASNVYYPVNQSTLTIPPWSNVAQEAINRYYVALEDIMDEEDIDLIKTRISKLYIRKDIERDYGCSEDMFTREIFKRFKNEDEEITEQSLLINEYKAFCMPDVDDPYFKTSSEPVPEKFLPLIKQVKLVKRLREVQVLLGFRRIIPEHDKNFPGAYTREFTPISKQPMKWLPAVELFGEGIFIEFNEDEIKRWEKSYGQRYSDMAKKIDNPNIGKDMQLPRYVLLHTLSHLLIRQLSFQCGYSSASLKEKIYSTYNEFDEPMCGILIYTATTDCDGSLGGLVREGTTEHMVNTLNAVLQGSSWCSNDPICIESKSQGFKSMNYAACHACLLLPETSCESRNCLLDRASIIGLPDDKDVGFFNQYI